MKRIALLLAGSFLLIANVSLSQGIDDRAVIPVAVTLNSILRLNVTSGGNIEFNFNTLMDYENGINTGGLSAAYQTKFNVASSVNWDVLMYAEDADLIGTDVITDGGNTANTMALDNIGYSLASEGDPIDNYYFGTGVTGASIRPLVEDTDNLLIGYDGTNTNAGDIYKNSFTINWRCGTAETGMNTQSILEQPLAADRYATNVFLILEPTNYVAAP